MKKILFLFCFLFSVSYCQASELLHFQNINNDIKIYSSDYIRLYVISQNALLYPYSIDGNLKRCASFTHKYNQLNIWGEQEEAIIGFIVGGFHLTRFNYQYEFYQNAKDTSLNKKIAFAYHDEVDGKISIVNEANGDLIAEVTPFDSKSWDALIYEPQLINNKVIMIFVAELMRKVD